jgi:thiol-disulfide isomerase/thioredoxin
MKWLISVALAAILALSSLTAIAASDAPDIKLPGLQGEVDLDALIGKVVYLDFWASWCKPCVKSFPWMKKMKASYQAQDFEILAVNLDKDRALADAFLKKMQANFLVGFDPEGATAISYQLRGMPSSFLIGRDGKIYATHIGFRDKDKVKIETAIKQLLVL